MMPSPFLEARHIQFSYSTYTVLNGINFCLNPAEVLAIVGPSGCGKSTLLKIVGNIIKPTGGELTSKASRYAYVSQEDGLLPWKNIFENVSLPYELKGESLSDDNLSTINNAIDMMGLSKFKEFYPHQLSGGMKKRVELARALAYEPDLLLLDEPFSALDIITRERLNLLCKSINQEKSLTIVFVTHSMEEATFLAHQIVLLGPPPSTVLSYTFPEQTPTIQTSYALSQNQQNEAQELRIKLATVMQGKDTEDKAPLTNSQRPVAKHSLYLNSIGLIAFLGLVSIVKRLFSIPDYLIPYPSDVAILFVQTLWSGAILKDLSYTFIESICGFLLTMAIVLPLSYFLSREIKLKELTTPVLVIMNSIPIIAIAPLFVLWIGIGLTTKILIVFLIIFFPFFITAMQAFSIARIKILSHKNFFKPTLGRLFFKLELPSALPQLFAGIKVALSTSIMGSVVSEFVSGSDGLGSRMTIAKASFDIPMMFVALSWIVILALCYYKIMLSLEKHLLKHLLYA